MTCIVGMVHDGQVFLGGDAAAVGGDGSLTAVAAPKVFANGPAVLGYTTSFRLGQLLQYRLTLPERLSSESAEQYLATRFVDAVRDCFKAGGYAERENEQERGGCFLVGYAGRLWTVQEDYSVLESRHRFAAVGAGAAVAQGALAILASGSLPPPVCLERALQAAAELTVAVRGPWSFVMGGARRGEAA